MNVGLTNPTKLISTALALAAFLVAIISGLAADNAGTTILLQAIISMIVCQVLGLAIGGVAERVIREHTDRYKQENPIHKAPAEEVIEVDPVEDEDQPGFAQAA